MIKVISPFSLLNDDFKAKDGKMLPVIMSYTDSIGFGGVQAPFFIIFTDKNA